jgi:kumamolisin
MLKRGTVAMIVPVATAGLLLFFAGGASAQTLQALATPGAAHPAIALIQPVTDIGPADPDQTMSLSIVLKLVHERRLAAFIEDTVTPTSPSYHKFLNVDQFRAQYAPPATVATQIVDWLDAHGIESYAYSDGLIVKAVGPASAFEQLFGISIEDYSSQGEKFYAVNKQVKLPPNLQKYVLTTVGLTDFAAASSDAIALADTQAPQTVATPIKLPKHGTQTHDPGQFTVGDAARVYGVTGLYKDGITGAGETVGIATFANFHVPDAYHYWSAIHLKTKPNRIRQVFVDGGAPIGKAAGSIETALDVEQSGGMAPDANIVVYDAANTDEGFVDVFYKAATQNVVDSLSVSWGSPELFYLASGERGQLEAMNQAFMELAAQGISTFAAAGDGGAFAVNGSVPYPFVSRVVSVTAPASDPYVTAVGGTTLAGSIRLDKGWVNVPQTRAWGWNYLSSYINANYGQYALYTKDIFPVGGGGGVSSVWGVPFYQKGIPSIQKTPPDQQLIDFTTQPPSLYYALKGGFAGRNVPDIALDADPYTGYLVYSTPDGGWVPDVGGTSIGTPQMNGITALLDQYLGTRLGLLNGPLYQMSTAGDYGPGQPLTAITSGSNWYYSAIPGYNPATGVGSPQVTEIAHWLRRQMASAR